MPGHVHALPNTRVIGMLGRKVPLGNVIGEFNRDPDTDQHGHKNDQKVSLRCLKHDRPCLLAIPAAGKFGHGPMIAPFGPDGTR
jgi:hypothetical protein